MHTCTRRTAPRMWSRFHARTRARTHTHKHTHTCAQTHTQTHTHTHTHAHTHTCTHTHVRTDTRTRNIATTPKRACESRKDERTRQKIFRFVCDTRASSYTFPDMSTTSRQTFPDVSVTCLVIRSMTCLGLSTPPPHARPPGPGGWVQRESNRAPRVGVERKTEREDEVGGSTTGGP